VRGVRIYRETLTPHPTPSPSRSRIYPTSADLKCRTRVNPSSVGEGADRVRRNRRHCRARPGNPSSSQNVFRRMMDPRVKPAGDGSRWSSLTAVSCPARNQACADRVNLSALPGNHVLLSSSAKDRMARELERLVPPRAPTYTRPASILRECDTAHTSLLTLSLKSRQGKKRCRIGIRETRH
jgi:hypothetical protein